MKTTRRVFLGLFATAAAGPALSFEVVKGVKAKPECVSCSVRHPQLSGGGLVAYRAAICLECGVAYAVNNIAAGGWQHHLNPHSHNLRVMDGDYTSHRHIYSDVDGVLRHL